MSDYEGFITRDLYLELMHELHKVADTRGLENKIQYLYQPDTDMDDKICEDFEEIKWSIINELIEMISEATLLANKISDLEEK